MLVIIRDHDHTSTSNTTPEIAESILQDAMRAADTFGTVTNVQPGFFMAYCHDHFGYIRQGQQDACFVGKLGAE